MSWEAALFPEGRCTGGTAGTQRALPVGTGTLWGQMIHCYTSSIPYSEYKLLFTYMTLARRQKQILPSHQRKQKHVRRCASRTTFVGTTAFCRSLAMSVNPPSVFSKTNDQVLHHKQKVNSEKLQHCYLDNFFFHIHRLLHKCSINSSDNHFLLQNLCLIHHVDFYSK